MFNLKNIPLSKFNKEDTVFYAFDSNNSIIEGIVTDITMNLHCDPLYTYSLITNEGKSYKASEKNLFSTEKEAFPQLKVSIEKDIVRTIASIKMFKIFANKLEPIVLSINDADISPSVTIFDKDIKFFSEDDSVFITPPMYYFNETEEDDICDILFFLEGRVVHISGTVSTELKTNNVFYDIDCNGDFIMFSGLYRESDVFSSKNESLIHCLNQFKDIIDKKENFLNKLKSIISKNL